MALMAIMALQWLLATVPKNWFGCKANESQGAGQGRQTDKPTPSTGVKCMSVCVCVCVCVCVSPSCLCAQKGGEKRKYVCHLDFGHRCVIGQLMTGRYRFFLSVEGYPV